LSGSKVVHFKIKGPTEKVNTMPAFIVHLRIEHIAKTIVPRKLKFQNLLFLSRKSLGRGIQTSKQPHFAKIIHKTILFKIKI
jgi:hypothetical protein